MTEEPPILLNAPTRVQAVMKTRLFNVKGKVL